MTESDWLVCCMLSIFFISPTVLSSMPWGRGKCPKVIGGPFTMSSVVDYFPEGHVPPVGTRSLLLLSLSRHALPTAPTHTPQEIPRVNFLPTLTSFSRFPPTLLQSCITWAHRQSPPWAFLQMYNDPFSVNRDPP